MLEICYVALHSGPTNFVQMKARGSKMALHQGVLGSNHRNKKKKSKSSSSSSSSDPLCSDFEILYVALSSGLLPNVFKWWGTNCESKV